MNARGGISFFRPFAYRSGDDASSSEGIASSSSSSKLLFVPDRRVENLYQVKLFAFSTDKRVRRSPHAVKFRNDRMHHTFANVLTSGERHCLAEDPIDAFNCSGRASGAC